MCVVCCLTAFAEPPSADCTCNCTKLFVTLWCTAALQPSWTRISIIVAWLYKFIWAHVNATHIVQADTGADVMQVRYQKGIQTMLDQWVNKKPFEEDNYIVREGKLAGQYS